MADEGPVKRKVDELIEANDADELPKAEDLGYHPTNARMWIGQEEEYDDGQGKKLFIDGADEEEIRFALDTDPEIQELYFAHGFDPDVVRAFENQIRITLEVRSPDVVPEDMRGLVNVILRLPNWISAVKQRDGTSIQVADLKPSMNPTAVWDGRKAYPTDEVLE